MPIRGCRRTRAERRNYKRRTHIKRPTCPGLAISREPKHRKDSTYGHRWSSHSSPYSSRSTHAAPRGATTRPSSSSISGQLLRSRATRLTCGNCAKSSTRALGSCGLTRERLRGSGSSSFWRSWRERRRYRAVIPSTCKVTEGTRRRSPSNYSTGSGLDPRQLSRRSEGHWAGSS